MIELIQQLLRSVESNPTLSGAVSLTLTGAILFLLKVLPMKLINFVKRQITTTVNLNNYNMTYYDLLNFLNENPYVKWSRSFQLNNGKYGCENLVLGVGPGIHFFNYKGKIFSVRLTEQSNSNTEKIVEKMTVTYLGRNQSHIENLTEDLNKIRNKQSEDEMKIYSYTGDRWQDNGYEYKRSWDTLIVNESIKNKLINHIEDFLNNKELYLKLGIPYRTTVLLHGPPGTGKTSIIKVLASYFGFNISYIPANSGNLSNALVKAPSRLVAIEDIDSMIGIEKRTDDKKNKNAPKESSMDSLLKDYGKSKCATVLNALDGIGSFKDKIVIMTTNHPEKLDEAFLRKGRLNLNLMIPKLSINDLSPEMLNLIDGSDSLKGCDIQYLLLENEIKKKKAKGSEEPCAYQSKQVGM